MMLTTATLFTLIIAVTAFPSHYSPSNSVIAKREDATCDNTHAIHCCNADISNKIISGGDVIMLLGQCNEISDPVFGANRPVQSVCSQSAFCCGKTEKEVRI